MAKDKVSVTIDRAVLAAADADARVLAARRLVAAASTDPASK